MARNAPLTMPERPWHKMRKDRYGIGVQWDNLTEDTSDDVDIDLQAVMVNKSGFIVDAVYYNNLSAMGGAIGHTGDEYTGDTEGFDETIWVQFSKLPKDIVMIIFVVAAYNQGSLMDADNGEIVLIEEYLGRRLNTQKMEKTAADVDVVLQFRKLPDGSWEYQQVEEFAESGSHFLDIIEPTIGDLIRKQILNAPAEQHVTFVMGKGAMADFPAGSLKRLSVGIGGTIPKGKPPVDLDIVAIFYSSAGKNLGLVGGNHPPLYGVSHSGDEVLKKDVKHDWRPDDETLVIDLPSVPDTVVQIFLVMTVDTTFHDVGSAYCKVYDQALKELVQFDVKSGGKAEHDTESGVIVGRLVRSLGQRWAFQALGQYFERPGGKSWKEAQLKIKKIFKTSPDSKAAPKRAKSMVPAAQSQCSAETHVIPAGVEVIEDDHQQESVKEEPELKMSRAKTRSAAKIERMAQMHAAAHEVDAVDEASAKGISSTTTITMREATTDSGPAQPVTGVKSVKFAPEGGGDDSRSTKQNLNSGGAPKGKLVKKGTMRLLQQSEEEQAEDENRSLLSPKKAMSGEDETPVEPQDDEPVKPAGPKCCRLLC